MYVLPTAALMLQRQNWEVATRDHMAQYLVLNQKSLLGFPGDSMVKNPPASVGDMGSIPNPRRFYIPQSN